MFNIINKIKDFIIRLIAIVKVIASFTANKTISVISSMGIASKEAVKVITNKDAIIKVLSIIAAIISFTIIYAVATKVVSFILTTLTILLLCILPYIIIIISLLVATAASTAAFFITYNRLVN